MQKPISSSSVPPQHLYTVLSRNPDDNLMFPPISVMDIADSCNIIFKHFSYLHVDMSLLIDVGMPLLLIGKRAMLLS